MSTGTEGQVVTSDFLDRLTPDTLSALMRSTWTWDDRAMRRDLSALLVQVGACRGDVGDPDVAAALRAYALETGARFVAAALGPQLVADLGSPFRGDFLSAATDPAVFARMADDARAAIRPRSADYLCSCGQSVTYPDEPSSLSLAVAGPRELGSAMRAFGHADSTAPLRGNVALALQTLRALGPDGSDLAGRVESGDIRATVAAAERSGSWDPALVRARAVPDTAGWKLTGAKHFVPDAAGVDVILTVARSVAGPSLFAVDVGAPGVTVTPLDVVDPGRPLCTVELEDTPAALLGREGQGGVLMRRSIDLAMTALAGEQVGLLERAIAILARHERVWVEDELVQTVLDHAAAVSLWTGALAESADGAAATMAHIACTEASLRVSLLAARIADDAESAALLRRTISASSLFGGPAAYHERLLDRLGI